jgi:threonine synthase
MLVAMPTGAPAVTRAECVAAGADLRLVDGLISDAGRLVAGLTRGNNDWTDVATLKEPYRIEGKKTMGFEIAEQLGWRMPDVIVYPTGGGVGLIGIDKALQELLDLGWVAGRLPRLVSVQSTGCAPIVRAFEQGADESEPWVDARTVAFGITVPKAIGDFLVLDAVRRTSGTAIAVDDSELLADVALAGRLEGLFMSPEGAATVSAVRRLRDTGWIDAADEVVVLNTGAGILYPDTVPVDTPVTPVDAL